MRRVEISLAARRDLREIAVWTAERSPRGATKLMDGLEGRIGSLSKDAIGAGHHPFLGPPLRRVLFRDYEIFFHLTPTRVVVVAVLHGARDLPHILAQRGHD